jgi:hypothetical protein
MDAYIDSLYAEAAATAKPAAKPAPKPTAAAAKPVAKPTATAAKPVAKPTATAAKPTAKPAVKPAAKPADVAAELTAVAAKLTAVAAKLTTAKPAAGAKAAPAKSAAEAKTAPAKPAAEAKTAPAKPAAEAKTAPAKPAPAKAAQPAPVVIWVFGEGIGRRDQYALTLDAAAAARLLTGDDPFALGLKLRKRVVAMVEGSLYSLYVYGKLGAAARAPVEAAGIGLLKECHKYGHSAARNASTKTCLVKTTLDKARVLPIDAKDPIVVALSES